MYFLVLQIKIILLHYEMVKNLEMYKTNSATSNGHGNKNQGSVELDTYCTSFQQKSARGAQENYRYAKWQLSNG